MSKVKVALSAPKSSFTVDQLKALIKITKRALKNSADPSEIEDYKEQLERAEYNLKKLLSESAEESTSATVNPFLDADGHFNITKVQALNEKIAIAVDKFVVANPTLEKTAKPTIIYAVPRKAKPVKYSKSLEAKKDLKYLTARAIKVVSIKRMTEAGKVRNMPILNVYDKAIIGPLAIQCKTAVSALTRHYNKALKTKEGVTKIRTKNREESNAEYEASVSLLKTLLAKSGIKDTDMVEAQGMMGKTVLLKVGKDNVVSIGKADMARFRAAVKASKVVAESSDLDVSESRTHSDEEMKNIQKLRYEHRSEVADAEEAIDQARARVKKLVAAKDKMDAEYKVLIKKAMTS
jgi:hypothetical protein